MYIYINTYIYMIQVSDTPPIDHLVMKEFVSTSPARDWCHITVYMSEGHHWTSRQKKPKWFASVNCHPASVELKDVSEGDSCWETRRRVLISRANMKEESATELSQPLLFDAAHLQPPSLGLQCLSEARCCLQIFLSGLMLLSCNTPMHVSCSARPEH